MKTSIITALLVSAVITATMATAQVPTVPRYINFQGKLTDTNGLPLNGTYEITFNIYSNSPVPAPANWVWGETHASVEVQRGLFSVLLGSFTNLDMSCFPFDAAGNTNRWLEIRVGSDLLSPTKEFVAVPYAFRASDADMVDGKHWWDIVVAATNQMVEKDPTVVGWVKDGVSWVELKGQGMPAVFADGVDDGITSETDPTVVSWVKDGESWTELKDQGMPAVFADGVDDGLTGTIAPNYVPRWDSATTQLITGTIYNDPVNDRVGIGTPSPAAKLDVNGHIAVRSQIYFNPLPDSPPFPHSDAALDVNGHVGIRGLLYALNGVLIGGGDYEPKYDLMLDVYGSAGIHSNLYYVGDLIDVSDARIKLDQQQLDYGLAQVMALQPKRYNQAEWEHDKETGEIIIHPGKISKTNEIGLVAQEVQKVIPEAVHVPENENNAFWGLSYDTLIPVLIKAIQEQQAQIEALKQENQALESGSLTETLTADFDGDGKTDTALWCPPVATLRQAQGRCGISGSPAQGSLRAGRIISG